jgi:hydrogenase maturation protease
MIGGVVVIGVGNTDRGDDGAGPAVASQVELAATTPPATVIRRSDPTALVDDWAGADTAYLVDARRPGGRPGTVRRVEVGDAPIGPRATGYSSHGFGVADAIELARALGRLPRRLIVFIVEGQDFRIGAGLSGPVTAATRAVAGQILDEIDADGDLRPYLPGSSRRSIDGL